ncbi:relaxase/mobilization nuclease domain-containing protein [Notoacmeibacter sp. MSK16QG-6]|uniref:relaxase/mobilization nuclease domain-containing protein n=1 Tax=Notoacmeibacter sp. MSK16QG-6 TaxID=2957982 RepID=UPI0020A19313|nr:conjugal transfer protein TraA [Notoacmeibacter sp. MSK16QG-6]MCP1201113.1 conjugal transfer protein TraA [Notoacmeibacter sp. MSK16QG-6]
MAELFLGAFEEEWERRKAARLHELELGERRRSRLVGEVERDFDAATSAAAGKAAALNFGRTSGFGGPFKLGSLASDRPSAERPMTRRFEGMATGSQAAVVKMASYGGAARVGAMVNYVSRKGELSVENERGERIEGQEELARVRGDWDHLMKGRAESRDIGGFRVDLGMEIAGPDDASFHDRVRDVLTSGFDDRHYVYGVERHRDGSATVSGVIVLRSGAGKRLTADAKAAAIVQAQFDESHAGSSGRATFSFDGYGNGVEYGTSRVRGLVERHRGDVWADDGRLIADDEQAGDLVQKEWRGELHSRKSRDVMHLILSARAGTDPEAFRSAARGFLAAQFGDGGHRYVFAVHDPADDPKEAEEGGKRPHIHAHAIITMRSEFGDRIETSPAIFRQWREALAEQARGQGIAMEMTDRRETASPPAFTQNQVRPIDRRGATRHVGTSAFGQARYDNKRAGAAHVARSGRSQDYAIMASKTWGQLALASGDNSVRSFAKTTMERLESTRSGEGRSDGGDVVVADFRSKSRTNMVVLATALKEGDEMAEMTRAQFETYEKGVEKALFQLDRDTPAEERADFEDVAQAARAVVNIRREMVELREERDALEANEGRENEAGSDQSERDDDIDNAAWDAAVERHGLEAVEAANDLLIEVATWDSAMDDAARNNDDSRFESYDRKRELALEDVAKLAQDGNSYAREVVEQDDELKAISDRLEKEAASGPGEASAISARDEREPEEGYDRDNPEDRAQHDVHDLHEQVAAVNRKADEAQCNEAKADRSADQQTDPARQQVPRSDAIERQDEERDRDELER